MNYRNRKDNEGWTERSGKIFRMACCDCGLVHDMVLVSDKRGNIGIAAKRNNRATAQRRHSLKSNQSTVMTDGDIEILFVIRVPLLMDDMINLTKGVQETFPEKLYIRNCAEGYEVFKKRTKEP